MKKIFITGDDLLMSLMVSPIHVPGETKSSFAINVKYVEGGKIQERGLILFNRRMLCTDPNKRTVLSFDGTLATDGKEPLFFTGLYDKNEGYEDCYLLVDEPEIFEINIGKHEFIGMVKNYCELRDIPVGEDGNVLEGGFPLFENLPKGPDAPGVIKARNRRDIEIHPIMHNDFFPIMYKREDGGSEEDSICFGTFISDRKIKIYTPEEAHLLGMERVIA